VYNDKVNAALEDLVSPHIESYNAFVEDPNVLVRHCRGSYFKFRDKTYLMNFTQVLLDSAPRHPLGDLIYPREVSLANTQVNFISVVKGGLRMVSTSKRD
jgi:hypothetical protein